MPPTRSSTTCWRAGVAHQACDIKGRAGVAVASRLPVSAVRVGLGAGEPEPPVDTGRWVEADLELPDGGRLTVVSAYIHSGTVSQPETMVAKYAYLEKVTARLRELAATGEKVVLAGDLNIAHRNVDIKNWKGNLKSAGFLPEERAYVDVWLDQVGLVDLGRVHGGEGPGPFTWWSWRGRAFDNDSGWRIDYQLATPSLAERAVKVEVDRAPSHEERWSDHAPSSSPTTSEPTRSGDPLGGRGRRREQEAGGAEPFALERGAHGVRHGLDLVRTDERDRGAAEPAARHPCAQGARDARRVDRDVELDARHLVVVAQRRVRRVQQRADGVRPPPRAAAPRARAPGRSR